MLKTRLLLVLVGILSLSWCFGSFYWVNKSHSHDFGAVDMLLGSGFIFGPFMSFAAILMLVFSFFRVSESEDGRLMYDPNNLYWKLLRRQLEGNISLCKAYWFTSFITFVAVFFSGAVVMILWAMYTQGIWKVLVGFKILLPLVAFFGSFCIPIIFVATWPNNELVRKFSLRLLLAIFAGWAVGLPFYIFLFKNGLTMSASIAKYLEAIGQLARLMILMIPVYACLGLSLWLIKYISSCSSDSLLKRMFSTLKENMCPILYERTTAGK